MPKLSVCITHYNRPEKLAATLESLCRQTRQPDEVFLWDDHSPRDPTEVANQFRNRFKHFVFHRNARNLRMPGNLNSVIAQATGDFIANLHDADEFDPTLLEKWEAALIANPSAGLVFCGLDAAAKGGDRGRLWVHDYPACTSGREFFRSVYVGSSGSPIWGTVMVRRDAYDHHLPFDPQFRMWADVDMWMRICSTHDVAYVPEPLIILDNTETAVRDFSWEKFLITHRMPVANIYRMASGSDELGLWMQKQMRWTRRWYFQHLTARVMRGDVRLFIEGVALWKECLVRLAEANWRFMSEGPVRFVQEAKPRIFTA